MDLLDDILTEKKLIELSGMILKRLHNPVIRGHLRLDMEVSHAYSFHSVRSFIQRLKETISGLAEKGYQV